MNQTRKRSHRLGNFSTFSIVLLLLVSHGRADEVDQRAVIGRLIARGQSETNSRQFEKAAITLQDALRLSTEHGILQGSATANSGLGVVFYFQGEYEKSLTHLQSALSEFEQLDNEPAVIRQLLQIGATQERSANYPEAMEALRRARDLAEKSNQQQLVLGALQTMANVRTAQGHLIDAIELAQQGMALLHRLGMKEKSYPLQMNLAQMRAEVGQYEEAYQAAQHALAGAEASSDQLGIAKATSTMANMHRYLGNSERALETHEKALTLFRAIGSQDGVAAELGNQGIIHCDRGNYATGLDYFNRSMSAYRAAQQPLGMLRQRIAQASVFERQGNYPQALHQYDQALMTIDELDVQGLRATVQLNKGSVFLALGEYDRALEQFELCLAYTRNRKVTPMTATVLRNMGSVYTQKEQYTEALRLLEKALELALETDSLEAIALAQISIAEVRLKLGNTQSALTLTQEAIQIAERLQHADLLRQSYQVAGLAYRRLNRFEEAKSSFLKSINVIEKMRQQVAGGQLDQQQFFENKLQPYHDMVSLSIETKSIRDAFTFADRAKARALADDLLSVGGYSDRRMKVADQQREKELQSKIASLNKRILHEQLRLNSDDARLRDLAIKIKDSRLEYQRFESDLLASDPQSRLARGQLQSITVEDAAALLPNAETVLIEYVSTDENLYLFCVTKAAELQVKMIPSGTADLAKAVSHLRELINHRSEEVHAASEKLFQLLLAPVAHLIQDKSHIVFVPDGPLWSLPFAALQPKRNRYLIEDFSIVSIPSVGVLREIRRISSHTESPSATQLLAMGNPPIDITTIPRVATQRAATGDGFQSLPQAASEIQAIAKLHGTDRSRVFLGAQATEHRFKREAADARMLHLATHAVLNNSSPMYSYILLAPGMDASDDGLLEAWELMNLDLHLELAVLSACETAGAVRPGEGLLGLNWALFIAGCPASVSSLWKVEDHATKELMVAFHHHLTRPREQKGRVSKAEALREAQLTLIRDYDPTPLTLRGLKLEDVREPAASRANNTALHPFYWAAFVLVGDNH